MDTLPSELHRAILEHLPLTAHLVEVGLTCKAFGRHVLFDVSFARRHLRRLAGTSDLWAFLDSFGIRDAFFQTLPFVYQCAVFREVLCAEEWDGVKSVTGNDMEKNKMWFERWRLPLKRELKAFETLLECQFFDPTAQKNRAVRWAARKGYLPVVKLLINSDSDINPGDDDNYAVYCAAAAGAADVVDFLLLDPRVDPSADTQLAIQYAAEFGHLQVTRRLLQDPRVDPTLRDHNCPIRLAADNGHTEIVRLLLQDARVDPSDVNNYAIIMASRNGHLECVRLLLGHPRVDPGANVNEAIRDACAGGHVECVRLLLGDGRVDPSVVGNLPLRDACMNGHVEVVKLLLTDPRVDPAAEDNFPIQIAVESKQLEVVELLLRDPRVDPSVHDNYCLYAAFSGGSMPLVKMLVEHQKVKEFITRQDKGVIEERVRREEDLGNVD
ncbi:hypothetical protein HDU98_006195 [Podochytrium sp. JEL0797]|nr:hypothetical protein HDU98_006195 [Podochytrium sp. JEL0797]